MRSVRDDEVEVKEREFGEQFVDSPLPADDLRILIVLEQRLKDAADDRLGHVIGCPDVQRTSPPGKTTCKGVGQLRGNPEHLVGMVEHDLTSLGKLDIPSLAGQEGRVQLRFKRADLRTHRRLGEAEFFRCPRHVSVLGRKPEVVEVVVIEGSHATRRIVDGGRLQDLGVP